MIRKTDSWLAKLLCVSLCAALLTGTFPLSAAAVSQSEIEALRVKRDEIQAQRMEKQAFVDELKNSAVGILVQKRALDERNMYTIQQIQLNNEEIALYDQMISEKEQEVLHAQELEKEQLERYRSRVRAMSPMCCAPPWHPAKFSISPIRMAMCMFQIKNLKLL